MSRHSTGNRARPIEVAIPEASSKRVAADFSTRSIERSAFIEARDRLAAEYLSDVVSAGTVGEHDDGAEVHGIGIGQGSGSGELGLVLLTKPELGQSRQDRIRSRAERLAGQQVRLRPTAEFVAQAATRSDADARSASSGSPAMTGPIMLGDSCGHAHLGGSGTLGVLAWLDDGTLVVISNQHVFCDQKLQASRGDAILSPGPGDGGTPTRSAIASFEHHGGLSFKHGAINEVDAACASIDVHALANDVRTLGPVRGTIEDAWVGMLVAKHGRTTGRTDGRVVVDSAKALVRYPRGVIEMTNLVLIESTEPGKPFAARGDSGSAILCRQQPTAARNLPTGLLCAVNTAGDAYACQMRAVCSKLSVTL